MGCSQSKRSIQTPDGGMDRLFLVIWLFFFFFFLFLDPDLM
jgi:hypothetical protein